MVLLFFAVTERLAAKLFGVGALERGVFTLQAVKRTEVEFGRALAHLDQDPLDQWVRLEAQPPIADQRRGAFRHHKPHRIAL